MPKYYSNPRHDVLNILPRRTYDRVLEVGGGDFPTALALRDKGSKEIWGSDIRVTNSPLDRFVHGSITDSAVNMHIPSEYFDLVIANDVIEHIVDTDHFLAVLREKLAPGGVLALSVPNARQVRLAFTVLVRGTFPRSEAGLFDQTHLRWFCRRDVVNLLDKHGFFVVHWELGGRLVPPALNQLRPFELVALTNLFVAQAK